jgi:hypothetical protein
MNIRKLEVGVEEFILGAIILLNILAFLGLLTPDMDYIKKLISWSAVGYLIYQTKPSQIFTGSQSHRIDGVLLTAYFLLFLKNFVGFAYTGEASTFLEPLYQTMLTHGTIIELGGLYAGFALLLYAAFRLATQRIHPRSVLGILHIHKKASFIKKFLCSYGVALGFFVVVFSLVMEWLAVAIDAPLLVCGLAVYVFFIIKHKHHMDKDHWLRKFGDFGSDFYKNIIEHLKYKHSALRVLSGMLILHFITDAFIFLWSHISGIHDPLYFGPLSREPISIVQSIAVSTQQIGLPTSIFFTVLSTIGLLFFLLFPVLTWYDLYKNEHSKINHFFLAVCAVSLGSFFLAPVTKLVSLEGMAIHGVDIIMKPVQLIVSPTMTWILLGILTASAIGLSILHRKFLASVLVFTSLVFVAWYSGLFYTSLVNYYTTAIPQIWNAGLQVLAVLFGLLFLVTTVFYVSATIYFTVDVIKHIKERILVT